MFLFPYRRLPPLRHICDIDSCIKTLLEDKTTDIVITVTESRRHPSFNMVTIDPLGHAQIAHQEDVTISRRQERPKNV